MAPKVRFELTPQQRITRGCVHDQLHYSDKSRALPTELQAQILSTFSIQFFGAEYDSHATAVFKSYENDKQ